MSIYGVYGDILNCDLSELESLDYDNYTRLLKYLLY